MVIAKNNGLPTWNDYISSYGLAVFRTVPEKMHREHAQADVLEV
jgi:hypothetical protein